MLINKAKRATSKNYIVLAVLIEYIKILPKVVLMIVIYLS